MTSSVIASMFLGTFSFLVPDSYSTKITNRGFTWGDNLGDAKDIMLGWKYADEQ